MAWAGARLERRSYTCAESLPSTTTVAWFRQWQVTGIVGGVTGAHPARAELERGSGSAERLASAAHQSDRHRPSGAVGPSRPGNANRQFNLLRARSEVDGGTRSTGRERVTTTTTAIEPAIRNVHCVGSRQVVGLYVGGSDGDAC